MPTDIILLENFVADHPYGYRITRNKDGFTVRVAANGGDLDPLVAYGENLEKVIDEVLVQARAQIAAQRSIRPKLQIVFQRRVEGVWTTIQHDFDVNEIATDKDLTSLGAISGGSPLPDQGVPVDFDTAEFPEGTTRINWSFIGGMVKSEAEGVSFDADFIEMLLQLYQDNYGARRAVFGFLIDGESGDEHS